MRRPLTALALTAAVVAAAGCGDRTPSDEEQVRDLLATFSRSVEKRDYQTLCDDVLAPSLLNGLEGIGLPCEVALRNSLGQVSEPRLTVGAVKVTGAKASAEVRTSAQGQQPSSDTIELVKIDGAWKVSDLSSGPAQASPSATATR